MAFGQRQSVRHYAPMSGAHIIGIAGGSCSGKTRLQRRLAERLGVEHAAVMLQDDYYFSRPEAQADNLRFNFDHPDAIDFERLAADLSALRAGHSVRSPHYDFALHERLPDAGKTIPARAIVLVDGILILTSPLVRDVLDYSVFIRCDAGTRLERRILRDVAERGRERGNVIAQFEQQVEPMHQEFVSPSADFADRVFGQDEVANDSALEHLYQHCRMVLAGAPVRDPG